MKTVYAVLCGQNGSTGFRCILTVPSKETAEEYIKNKNNSELRIEETVWIENRQDIASFIEIENEPDTAQPEETGTQSPASDQIEGSNACDNDDTFCQICDFEENCRGCMLGNPCASCKNYKGKNEAGMNICASDCGCWVKTEQDMVVEEPSDDETDG